MSRAKGRVNNSTIQIYVKAEEKEKIKAFLKSEYNTSISKFVRGIITSLMESKNGR